MYFEGVDDKYILISCNKCGHLLKFYKQYLVSYDENHCVVNTPLRCSCGNLSPLTIYKETENQKQQRLSIQQTKNLNEVRCPKCGSTRITAVTRKWSPLTGFFTNKVDRVCLNCKHKF